MSKGYTGDPANRDEETGSDTFIRYDLDNKLLGDHPITRGRNASEKISRIIAFTGQSLKGPEGCVAFMKLADTAVDFTPAPRGGDTKQTSAAGRAQGIAFKFGKGRVVARSRNAFGSTRRASEDEVRNESPGPRQSSDRIEHPALAVEIDWSRTKERFVRRVRCLLTLKFPADAASAF